MIPGPWTLLVAVGVFLAGSALGYRVGANGEAVKRLRVEAQVAQREKDALVIAVVARDELQRRMVERAAERDRLAAQDQETIDALERDLAKRPAAARCVLTPDMARRLRDIRVSTGEPGKRAAGGGG